MGFASTFSLVNSSGISFAPECFLFRGNHPMSRRISRLRCIVWAYEEILELYLASVYTCLDLCVELLWCTEWCSPFWECRFWAHMIMAYVFTFWTCYVLRKEYERVASMRLHFLASERRRPDQFTVRYNLSHRNSILNEYTICILSIPYSSS